MKTTAQSSVSREAFADAQVRMLRGEQLDSE
jgi:hypothetical protein